jgi:phenylacetate-CoA ligase
MLNPATNFDSSLRSIAAAIFDARDGLRGWKPFREEFLETCRKDPAALATSVATKLDRIVRHAYESSPYYRSAWNQMSLPKAGEFTGVDLPWLPLISKDTIRTHRTQLISRAVLPEQLVESYTGGTTGTQTKIFMDKECKINRIGRQWGVLQRCGYCPGIRRALVWGVESDLLPRSAAATLKIALRRYAASDEVLCCTVMSDESMRDYYERIKQFRPAVMYGYPTAVARLAAFIVKECLAPVLFRSIIVTAERLTVEHRSLIRQVFGGQVFNLYCMREYGCMGFECEQHRGLHIDAESIHVEIVRDGKVLQPGQVGEIVVTDLCNFGMPLIRSRTGDLGTLSAERCPCGLSLPLLSSLDGRETGSLLRPDGSVVTGLMLSDLFMEEPAIRAAQFVQERADQVEVLLETAYALSAEVEKRCIAEVRALMGPEVTILLTPVAEIERNPISGKLQEVICRIHR